MLNCLRAGLALLNDHRLNKPEFVNDCGSQRTTTNVDNLIRVVEGDATVQASSGPVHSMAVTAPSSPSC